MSFFLQSKRNTDFLTPKTPAPSKRCIKAAKYSVQKLRKTTSGYAPFGSTSKLDRSQKIERIKNPEVAQQQQNILSAQELQKTVQDKMQSIFKSRSERFLRDSKPVPGPGTYQPSKRSSNKQSKVQKINQSGEYQKFLTKKTTPSMPLDSLGYKYDQVQNYQKLKAQPINVPAPGTYELRKDFIKEQGLEWKKPFPIQKKSQNTVSLPGPGAYDAKVKSEKKIPRSCFESKTNRFEPKKIKKTIQPGPGEYNPQLVQRSGYNIAENHFNSKTPRFMGNKQPTLGPGAYELQKRKMKSTKSLHHKHDMSKKNEVHKKSQIERKTIFDVSDKSPGPGDYLPYSGMTFELQKSLLRKHNSSQFAKTQREVFKPENYQEPGPGEYNPQKPKNDEKGRLGYHKLDIVNLKEDPQELPSPFEYNITNYTIQTKANQSLTKLSLIDRKPFNSGSQRFKHYSNSKKKEEQKTYQTEQDTDIEMKKTQMVSMKKKTKKLIMTSVKVKVPFGISTAKYLENDDEIGIGPGAYDLKDDWVKKSHSIKSKVNKN